MDWIFCFFRNLIFSLFLPVMVLTALRTRPLNSRSWTDGSDKRSQCRCQKEGHLWWLHYVAWWGKFCLFSSILLSHYSQLALKVRTDGLRYFQCSSIRMHWQTGAHTLAGECTSLSRSRTHCCNCINAQKGSFTFKKTMLFVYAEKEAPWTLNPKERSTVLLSALL